MCSQFYFKRWKKQHKWQPKSIVGIFLGNSDTHASTVCWLINPLTSHIIPQYHIIVDNNFTSVHTTKDKDVITIWNALSTTDNCQSNYIKNFVIHDKTWKLKTFNFDTLTQRLQLLVEHQQSCTLQKI